jgi:hypothetical protein
MRDTVNSRGGFDRVLMAVAATFLAVSATSALAQSDAPRSGAAELAIDAAIPKPEPANVPPPTASDIKAESTASETTATVTPAADATKTGSTAAAAPVPEAPKDTAAAPVAPTTTPADVATTPAAASTDDTARSATAPIAAPAAPATASTPAAEPAKAASSVATADQRWPIACAT